MRRKLSAPSATDRPNFQLPSLGPRQQNSRQGSGAALGEIMARDGNSGGSVKFEIGRVISTGLAVFARNFVAFFVLTLVIGIPYMALSFGAVGSFDINAAEQTGQLPPGFWAMVIIGSLIYLLTYAVTQSVLI